MTINPAIGDLTDDEVQKIQLGDEVLEQWASLQEITKTGTYATHDHDSTQEHDHSVL